jgi:hypothetical protein
MPRTKRENSMFVQFTRPKNFSVQEDNDPVVNSDPLPETKMKSIWVETLESETIIVDNSAPLLASAPIHNDTSRSAPNSRASHLSSFINPNK